jgi:hypothetical protein
MRDAGGIPDDGSWRCTRGISTSEEGTPDGRTMRIAIMNDRA